MLVQIPAGSIPSLQIWAQRIRALALPETGHSTGSRFNAFILCTHGPLVTPWVENDLNLTMSVIFVFATFLLLCGGSVGIKEQNNCAENLQLLAN